MLVLHSLGNTCADGQIRVLRLGGRKGSPVSTKKNQKDEFAGFVANPQALQRGDLAVRALRRQSTAIGITGLIPRWELLERMAQVEINRFLRAEITAKKEQWISLALGRAHSALHNEGQGTPGFGASSAERC